MERVLAGHRWMDPENLPGTLRLALTLNAGLPPRKRWPRETLGGAMKELFGLPKRELLKRAHQAMRAAGIPVARGERLDPRGTLAPLLDTLREVGTALLADREMSVAEVTERLTMGLLARGVPVEGYPVP